MNGSLRRRVGLLTIGTSAVKTSQVILALLLVRMLSPQQWSGVALAMSIYLAALTLGSLNLQQSLVFFLPLTDPAQHWGLVRRTAALMAFVGFCLGAVLVTAGHVWGIFGLAPSVLALIAIAITCELPTVCAPAVFVCRDRLAAGAAWDIGVTSLQIVAMILPAALGMGVHGVIWGLALSSAARLVLFGGIVTSLRPERLSPLTEGLLTRQLTYCLPLGLTMATGVLTRSVDKWFVAWHDPSEVGVYVIAAQELPILAVLPYAGGAAVVVELVRRFAAGEPRDAHEVWARQAATMSALVLPITLFLVAAAPELFALLFPSAYGSGVLPFRCFTLITLHRVTEYGIVLRAANRNTTLVHGSAVLLGLNAVLAFVGAMLWGTRGVSIGCLSAFTLSWLYTLHLLSGVFDLPWSRVFPWRQWASALAVATGAAAVALCAAELVAGTAARLLVKVAVFGAALLTVRWLRRSPAVRAPERVPSFQGGGA